MSGIVIKEKEIYKNPNQSLPHQNTKIVIPVKNIPLYEKLPNGKVLIDNLEQICLERLNQLQLLENKIASKNENSNNNNNNNSNDMSDLFDKKMSVNSENSSINWITSDKIDNDQISFFMIASLFCDTEANRIWLSSLEAKMFQERINHHNIDKKDLLDKMKIPIMYETIEVNSDLYKKIHFNNKKREDSKTSKVTVIKIPFEYVLNMIPSLNYYIHKGFVYIKDGDLSEIIKNVFKEECLRKYNHLYKSRDNITSDKRINNLFTELIAYREKSKVGNTSNISLRKDGIASISLKDIEDHSESTFPLCMTMVHRFLTRDSHLKHNGRLQYGLFLKGLGLTLDESLQFWKSKFSSKVTGDKFDKEYSYSIRHNYGMEGKRADYPPWSCSKLQSLSPPTSSEMHGCPFKIFSDDKLRSVLWGMGIKEVDVLKIMEKKKNNEFSVSCMRYFEAKFPDEKYEKVGIHPNYFTESAVKIIDRRNKKKKIVVEIEKNDEIVVK